MKNFVRDNNTTIMNVNNLILNQLKNKKLLITAIFIGLITKLFLLNVKTGDFVCFLEPWIDFIKEHGYFSSLKYGFYDYTPSYIYILIIIAKTGLNPLFLVKFVSIAFEYLVAFFIGKIAWLKYKNNLVILMAIAVIPLLPTVLLNSSYLSQCDSIYSAFALGSIYFILKRKQLLSVLLLGIAFSFKMQTVVILPFFFVMMLRNYIKWYYFLVVPVVFATTLIPAWLFGRPFSDLFLTYIAQADHYRLLTMNFPNLYIWVSNDYYDLGKMLAISAIVLITLFTGILLSNKRLVFSFDSWIKLAFISSIIVPFILPGMHERYMYMGDTLGVLYFLVYRKNVQLPAGILIVSLYSYIRCSRYNDVLPMWPAFFVYLSVIILTASDFIKNLKNDSKAIE